MIKNLEQESAAERDVRFIEDNPVKGKVIQLCAGFSGVIDVLDIQAVTIPVELVKALALSHLFSCPTI